uniref:Uncharacterized protein n=1 Tax=Rhizophora mucronata TaxID=61149 RepID=A0A2P2P2Y3_RHIMU
MENPSTNLNCSINNASVYILNKVPL